MTIQIDKNVLVPKSTAGAKTKYPFSTMEIGDSFLGDRGAQSSAHSHGRKYGLKFVTRVEGDGIRIWRVE